MDARDIALMAKIARKEAGRVVPDVIAEAVAAAEKVARSIIPEKGDDGYTPIKGVDYFDGKDAVSPVKGIDYDDGKDGYTPIKGKDYRDGKDIKGKDGASWHLLFEEPDEDYGSDGDFVLDGKSSNIYHKKGGKWEFVVYLKAEVPQFQMQPPRAYSEDKIRSLVAQPAVRYTAIDTTTSDEDEVIICTAALTVTLHTPVTALPTKPKRIKRAGAGDVTVTTVDASGYVLNINYQAVDVQWTGSEWISL